MPTYSHQTTPASAVVSAQIGTVCVARSAGYLVAQPVGGCGRERKARSEGKCAVLPFLLPLGSKPLHLEVRMGGTGRVRTYDTRFRNWMPHVQSRSLAVANHDCMGVSSAALLAPVHLKSLALA
jgi:hypothetical protein